MCDKPIRPTRTEVLSATAHAYEGVAAGGATIRYWLTNYRLSPIRGISIADRLKGPVITHTSNGCVGFEAKENRTGGRETPTLNL